MTKIFWGFITTLVVLGSIGLMAGTASANEQETFCDNDRVVHNIYRGDTKSMQVVSAFHGCVGQQFLSNANGTRGAFICSWVYGFTMAHQNTRISGNVSMERGWSSGFNNPPPDDIPSGCGGGNGSGGATASRIFSVNARYLNNRRLPFVDQRTNPTYRVFQVSGGTAPIDYSVVANREGIIREVQWPDWEFGSGQRPAPFIIGA